MFFQATFPHRQNPDGTHDSICTQCFATVATVGNEDELSARESAHVCDPVALYRVSQCVPPKSRGTVLQFPHSSERDRTVQGPSRA